MVINTNVAALTSANNLNNSTSMLNQSLARLSSGSQIVTAADNPAGLAESISLTSLATQVGAANNAVSNASSFAQTQDGYLQQVGSALQQMSQLSIEVVLHIDFDREHQRQRRHQRDIQHDGCQPWRKCLLLTGHDQRQ
jgi:flagellin-like hook-associated protein FlgL